MHHSNIRSLKRTAIDKALMMSQGWVALPLIRSLKQTARDKVLNIQAAVIGALSFAVGFSRRNPED